MRTITQEDILTATANFLGKSSLPNGELKDWKRFAQAASDYSLRYHTWIWTIKKAQLVNKDGNILVPEDLDYYGYREFDGSTEQHMLDSGATFYLQFHEGHGRYEVIGGSEGQDLVYQVEPPKLDESTKIYFPSEVTIAMGTVLYAKQGENPRSAEVSQEWDIFHNELNKHVTNHDKSTPMRQRPQRRVARTRHEMVGSFPGQVR